MRSGGVPDLADMVVVKQIVEFAAVRGLDVGPMLSRLAIERADVDDPDAYVDTEQWFRLQVMVGEALHDPLVGLRLVEFIGLRDGYGLPGALFALSGTARDALDMLSRLLVQFLPRTSFTATEIGDVVRVRYVVDMPDELTWAHRQEVIGGMRKNTQAVAGEAFTPAAVRLKQRDGSPEDLKAFFGVDVETGAEFDEIDLPLAPLMRPSPTADPAMLRHLYDAVATQLQRRRAWAGQRASLLHLVGCEVDLANGRVERADATVWLTSRERELLEFFAARPNKVVTHTEIERDVWRMVPTIVSHAPAVAVRRLRQKIEPEGARPTNLLTVFGEGWKLVVR